MSDEHADPVITESGHLHCRRCGYDLHGIPEVRCPECGYRYEFAALRTLLAADEVDRFGAAGTIVIVAAVAGALHLNAFCSNPALGVAARYAVVIISGSAAFFVWLKFGGVFE